MKIVKIEDLHCDAGWRVNSFLKVTTDDGLVGWSEYMEGYGAQGLTAVIRKMAERLIGHDPRPVERISAMLYAASRQAAGGVNAMAIAAIENALVDIKAKALGVPVYEMLGGPIRDRLLLYWSHCGTYRARHAQQTREWMGVEPIRTLDDIVRLGADFVMRVALRQAPVPALFRAAGRRLRDHRRGLERHSRIGENRRDGRRLRGQCCAAQFQRPSRQSDQRAFLRRRAELQGHGDRH